MIVDGVSVGDEIAAIAGEHVIDRTTRVLGRVLEQHVPLRGDDDPEVAGAAALGVLHEHAGGIDAEIRLRSSRGATTS
jgi:hypothetical protein